MGINIQKVSAYVILFCAILLGVETGFNDQPEWLFYFELLDIIIIGYFTFELIYRWNKKTFSIKEFLPLLWRKIRIHPTNNVRTNEEIVRENMVIEESFWLFFDFTLVLLGYLSFLRHLFDHPELILLLRMFRVFRIFRVFELNDTLKEIEKKIFSVIPTIVTFLALIFLIIYSYAIIGMYLYNFHTFDSIDFSNLYAAITGLFTIMTNGWSSTLTELRTAENVSTLVSEIYIISFFIFSVLITLNIFLAVMTTQIQDKLSEKMDTLNEKEDNIMETDIKQDEKIALLNQKLDQIIEEIQRIKSDK
jgi:voltage-gated sodium channel